MKTLKTMTTLTIALGAAALVAASAIASPAEARINERQAHQKARIVHGVKSGALTARETRGLVRQQARIQAYETKSRRDGPGLTPRERLRIEKMQDRASRNIYRQKHDSQRRR